MPNMGLKSYTLLPLARADLEEIWLYTKQGWSAEQADSYLGQIHAAFQRIIAGTAQVKDASYIRDGYCRVVAGSHYIFFRKVGDQAQIVRVLHQRMNVEAHL